MKYNIYFRFESMNWCAAKRNFTFRLDFGTGIAIKFHDLTQSLLFAQWRAPQATPLLHPQPDSSDGHGRKGGFFFAAMVRVNKGVSR
ncbi:MAG: hypothetical protein AAGE89_13895, partial [Pseudomonadota bacterium]